jgi:hypothetical protein
MEHTGVAALSSLYSTTQIQRRIWTRSITAAGVAAVLAVFSLAVAEEKKSGTKNRAAQKGKTAAGMFPPPNR